MDSGSKSTGSKLPLSPLPFILEIERGPRHPYAPVPWMHPGLLQKQPTAALRRKSPPVSQLQFFSWVVFFCISVCGSGPLSLKIQLADIRKKHTITKHILYSL